MNSAVFLDRDNTLIHNDGDLGDPAKVKLVQGASSAIASLRGLGYKIVVITNQGGVARGKYTEADVDAVHQRINDLVKSTSGSTIDRFYYCPYHPEASVEKYRHADHAWRKPKPGMLLQAAKDLDIDLSVSWMVGDQLRDAQAGAAAGVRTILLSDDAEELTPLRIEQLSGAQDESGPAIPTFVARNLIEAVRIIAQQRKPETPEEIKAREKANRKWDPGQVRAARQGRDEPAAVSKPTPARPIAKETRPATSVIAEVPPPVEATRPMMMDAPLVELPAPRRTEPIEEPPARAVEAPRSTEPREDETLRQILQELRIQRTLGSDFSFAKMTAIVLQLIVVVCVAAAWFMGRENQDVFVRWMSCGVLLQLATIASLLFGK